MRKVPAASSATALKRATRSGRAASQRRSRPRPTITTSRKTTASRAMLPGLWSTKTKAPSAALWVAAAYSKIFTKSGNGRPMRNAPISPPTSTSLTELVAAARIGHSRPQFPQRGESHHHQHQPEDAENHHRLDQAYREAPN